jgi:hypothetical protein
MKSESPLYMTDEELREYIKNIGRGFCNKVMNVEDCGNNLTYL